ncbi:MAG: hypothetical protein ACP5N3_01450 [Candidatus Nanoarchaeia archaeon]
MDIIREYEKLINSEVFKEFKNSSEHFYLVHVYQMKGGQNESSVEFGFYNSKTDKIVVFETNPFMKRAEEEVFKEGKTIHPLHLETVKLSMEEALAVAERTRKEKYPSEIIYQMICILQNIDRQVWNITLISMSFNIINIRIDSESGAIVDTNIHSIMELGKRE